VRCARRRRDPRAYQGFKKFKYCVPSSFVHLNEIKSNVYVSPVIIYLPVSPVAPPKRTTFDLDTIVLRTVMVTLGNGVSESCEGDFTKDLNFLHHL
jgi:hypothetical protein